MHRYCNMCPLKIFIVSSRISSLWFVCIGVLKEDDGMVNGKYEWKQELIYNINSFTFLCFGMQASLHRTSIYFQITNKKNGQSKICRRKRRKSKSLKRRG
jgi:hypothetical protein